MQEPGLKPAPLRDPSVTGNSFTGHAVVLAPKCFSNVAHLTDEAEESYAEYVTFTFGGNSI